MTDINKLCGELEALLKEATPGPVKISEADLCIFVDIPEVSDKAVQVLLESDWATEDDIRLFAALRNAAQPLIDAARESVKLRDENKDLKEVLDDKRRLTRDLDVALSGPGGAAKQASLCDLIPSRPRGEGDKIMEWQQIGTAPKNSKDILVYCSDTNEQMVAFWSRHFKGYQFASGPNDGAHICHPTHWMPLPEPPTTESSSPPKA